MFNHPFFETLLFIIIYLLPLFYYYSDTKTAITGTSVITQDFEVLKFGE